MNNKAVLIIMDGYGLAAPTAGNAIAQARTPNLDRLFAENPTWTSNPSLSPAALRAAGRSNKAQKESDFANWRD